jgi:hypothetical protein
MPEAPDYLQRPRRVERARARATVLVAGLAVLVASLVAASAAAAATPSALAPGFKVAKIAVFPKGVTNCDDIGFLNGNIFVGCQDKTLSSGGGGNSTLVEFTPAGAVVKTWSIKHKIDGLAGDPFKHVVVITLDEDANSLMATVNPTAPAGQQLTYYTYSPDPRGATTPLALRTGGGTDHVSIDSAGHIFVTGSHAGTITGTAVFQVALSPPSSPTGTGTAALSPTFLDNATAAKANTGTTGTIPLHLGDVDSAAIVPASSPRFGGDFVITDQTALELVFADNIFKGTGLHVLKNTFGLDDLLWTTKPGGTLYLVDFGNPAVLPKTSASALYKVTGPFTQNMVLSSSDGVPDTVMKIDLNTGKLTPFLHHFHTTKGLLYLNPDGTQTLLPLNGASAQPVSSTTKTTSTAPAKKSGGSSNTALIIIIIVVALAVVGGGGYWYTQRR